MPDQTVIHNTFSIERTYMVAPERVFAALSDPVRKRRWYLESTSLDPELFEMDFRVGGDERSRYRFREGSPFPGVSLTSDGTFRDIVPNRRIVMSQTMTIGDKRISASLVTFELIPTATGTDLLFTHQAAFFEGSDGPQMREEGWRKLLKAMDAEI